MRKRDTAAHDRSTSIVGEWRPDGTIEIEADTVADAMARVAAEVGEDAQVVDARKAITGGIGGFCAKERVVLTAKRPANDLPSVLERMSRAVDAEETEFGAMLRRELAARDAGGEWGGGGTTERSAATPAGSAPAEPAVGTIVASEDDAYTLVAMDDLEHAPPPSLRLPDLAAAVADPQPAAAATVPEPLPAPTVPADQDPTPVYDAWRVQESGGGVEWGVKEVVRRGLPERIVAAVADIDPRDDLGWISGIASAVAPLCGEPLHPDGVIVGSHAARLADLLAVPMVEPLGMAPYAGGFSCSLTGTYDEQKWLDFVLAGRPLHVVIDDSGTWGDLLVADPSVVSWVGERGVTTALHLAATLGARLGYAPADGDPGRLVRVSPIDVALAVRQLMRRR